MQKALVIVESPAKAKTIAKYLGPGFQVQASLGHVRDLPQNRLGVDIENNFKPEYKIIPRSQKVIAELRKKAEKVDVVYLASDPDREGEAIAWHLYMLLKSKQKNIKRIEFQEVTKRAVQEAIRNAHEIDMNRVNAQQARRILDRLVGYQVSPLLWEKIQGGLSAGRVQTVALRLICEREEEIESFRSEKYYSVNAKLKPANHDASTIEARLIRVGDYKLDKLDFKERQQAEAIVDHVKNKPWTVANIKRQERQRHPQPVFTTSTLQQEAANKLNMSSKKTMMIAQQLYEGIDIGTETVGLITYMRTDSVKISDEALEAVRRFILEKLGKNQLPDKPHVYQNKQEAAQEAHEGIRPTDVFRTPEMLEKYLSKDQYKLYELIWRRFVASQMKAARVQSVQMDIQAGDRYIFRATGNTIVDPGFLTVYHYVTAKETILPNVAVGEPLILKELKVEEHETKPPERYTESKLIKELEAKGIGRPSTYASIIQTLVERQPYVEVKNKQFYPTEIGKVVYRELTKAFPELFAVSFTSHMEKSLDEISSGKKNWVDVLHEFYQSFSRQMELAKKSIPQIDNAESKNRKCPKCGGDIILRKSKYGKFWGCSTWPECDFKQSYKTQNGSAKCPECGGQLVLRNGPTGKFWGCTGFPKCRFTQPHSDHKQNQKSEKVCPDCGAPMRHIRGQTGSFWGCTKYPECKRTLPGHEAGKCPECGKPLIRRRSKSQKTKYFIGCSGFPDCTYVQPIQRSSKMVG